MKLLFKTVKTQFAAVISNMELEKLENFSCVPHSSSCKFLDPMTEKLKLANVTKSVITVSVFASVPQSKRV